MFEYPGLKQDDNLKDEVENLRLWLSRFVPELERKLEDLGTDNFRTAYNERQEGITPTNGAAKQTSTSAAVAEHLLDHNNPHGLTIGQLKNTGSAIVARETDNGWVMTMLGLMIQAKYVLLEAVSGEETQVTGLNVRTVDLGDWDVPFGSLSAAWPRMVSEDGWIGSHWGPDEETCGTVTIYGTETDTAETLVIIYGIGGMNDGGPKETNTIA